MQNIFSPPKGREQVPPKYVPEKKKSEIQLDWKIKLQVQYEATLTADEAYKISAIFH